MTDRDFARHLERSKQSKDIHSPFFRVTRSGALGTKIGIRLPSNGWMNSVPGCTRMRSPATTPNKAIERVQEAENSASSRNDVREKELAQKNLEVWLDAGGAEEFVARCRGHWTDRDWEKLVDSLKTTHY